MGSRCACALRPLHDEDTDKMYSKTYTASIGKAIKIYTFSNLFCTKNMFH